MLSIAGQTSGRTYERPAVTSPLLQELVLDKGPLPLFGRVFPRAVTLARDAGVELSFGSAEDLVRANQSNRANWLPLVPALDANYSALNDENFFCVLGHNKKGETVTAHAARLMDVQTSDFVEELTSLRLFYRDPDTQRQHREHCETTGAEEARALRGRLVYSGAAWVHPAYRRNGLSGLVPRVAKAYAMSRWLPDYICSLMTESVFRQGFAPRFGYDRVTWDVNWENSLLAPRLRLAIVWMDMSQLVRDLQEFLTTSARPQIDAVVRERRA